MALQHLRSSTADKRPTPAAMSDGQLALNTNLVSPGLFFKDSNGDSVKIGPVHVGATAPNVTPGAGGQAGNSKGEAWLDTTAANPILKVWNGSAFVAVQPVGTGTVVSTTDTGTVTSTMILDGTILNADINASAAIVDTKLATIATAGKVSNSATTATNANTASAIVARDASGNFTAGTITAALTGAASSNVLKAGDTMTGALVVPLASAATPSLTFTGDLNTGIYSPGADQLAVATNGTGRLFINSTGLVGIGTTSPTDSNGFGTCIDIRSSTGAAIYLRDSDDTTNDTFVIGRDNSNSYLSSNSGNIVIENNGSERARIDSSGRLLVGTTDASQASGTGVKLLPGGQVWCVGSSGDVYSHYNGGYKFYVSGAGVVNATSGTITVISDQRFKENIRNLDDGLTSILALQPRKFDWKEGRGSGAKDERGFIAQEFEQVFPDLISQWKDEAPDGEEPYKAVRADLIPVLVKAIQEQQAIIEGLEARLAVLESA